MEPKDIIYAPRNCQKMINFYKKRFQINSEHITYLQDPSYNQVKATMERLRKDCAYFNKLSTRKLVILFGYSGHGVIHNDNYIVLNEIDKAKRYYPLENKITLCAQGYPNVYVMGLFDCCREPVGQNEVQMARMHKKLIENK